MVLQDAGPLYANLQATVVALNEILLEISAYFIKTALVTLKEVDDVTFQTQINCAETRDRETSILFQGEDPVFCKRPVSSHRKLTYHEISFYDRDKDCVHPSLQYLLSRSCNNGIGFEIKVRLTLLLHSFYTELERYRYHAGCNIESVINFEIYKLVTNEAVPVRRSRGIQRSWKIEHSAARLWKEGETAHLTSCTELPRRFKGVRYRSGRAKNPWISEIKLPKEKKKTHIGCFATREEAARAYDVAAIYAGKNAPLNFEDSVEFIPPKGLENFIRKGQVDRNAVPTLNTNSVRCQGENPKETLLCFEHRIASQENAPQAFSCSVKEIGETTTSLIPPAKNSEISSTFHVSSLQEIDTVSVPTASGGIGAANMLLPTYQFSHVLVDTDETDDDDGTYKLAPEIPKEVDPGLLDLEDWTERLVELMGGSDQVERSAPLVSDSLNFPFEAPSDSLIDTSPVTPDFYQSMIDVHAINHTASTTDLKQLESSPATPFQQEFPPGQGTLVPAPSVYGGSSYANLEGKTESEVSFITAFQTLINAGDSSRNMELLLQLVRQHYDKHEIEVVLRPK